jgi:hypothetical protein
LNLRSYRFTYRSQTRNWGMGSYKCTGDSTGYLVGAWCNPLEVTWSVRYFTSISMPVNNSPKSGWHVCGAASTVVMLESRKTVNVVDNLL